MKFWTAADMADARVPGKITRIRDAVADAIEEHGWPGAVLARIGRSDHDHDVSRFEVEVLLAPGICLPCPLGTSEGLAEGWEDKSEDVDRIYQDVAEGLEACRDIVASLADVLDEHRRRARGIIAGWQRAGLPASLVDVTLAPYDHWRGDTVPKVIVLIETLGEDLRRTTEEVPVEAPGKLEQELEDLRPTLVVRNANRIALAEHGASGTIDQLALNAISRFHDVGEFLRGYARETRRWLPDSTAVHMSDGHVQAGTGVSTGSFDWYGDSVTAVAESELSQAELDAVVGRPATMLFEHPYLSDDILVSTIEASTKDGRVFVSASFRMPRKFFCSVTGRVWEWEDEEGGAGTVVPFRRRAQ